MIVYEVFLTDSDNECNYFGNLKDARKFYNDAAQSATLSRIETVEPTKQGVLAMLNRQGFSLKDEIIAEK